MKSSADPSSPSLPGGPRFRRAGQRTRERGSVPAAALALLLLLPARGVALTAATAADVCPSNANPCSVTASWDVAADSVLDFGTRAVSLTGSGQFNFGTGNGSILCGNFSATTANPAIVARGSLPGGGSAGGSVTVQARRRCSAASPQVPCLGDEDCDLGSCGTRRCSMKSTRTCTSDANCQLGSCGANKRCSLATAVRCTSNADCDLGTCPAGLTCARRGENPMACTSNSDCTFGSCSVGSASIALGGAISGASDTPGLVSLRAADSVTISKLVNVSSTYAESDGGSVLVSATAGATTLSAKVTATGGSLSQGGSVELFAGTDVVVGEEVNASGGDFDGGSVQIGALRDVVLARSLLASSVAGAGFGGEIVVDAGRDLTISSVSALSKTALETIGNTSASNSAGDGGSQDLTAGRNLATGANTRLVARGSAPDGQGGDVFLASDAGITLGGDLVAKADGGTGAGGLADIDAAGTLTVAAAATFDLSGGGGGGGDLTLQSGGDAGFGGNANVGAGNGGLGGSILLDSGADVQMTGVMAVSGTAGGSLEIDACRIAMTSGAKLDGKSPGGSNTLLVRESMRLLAGSVVTAGSGGSNTLVYRTDNKPPLLQGTITPAPKKTVFPELTGCPVCGNGEVDAGETCDDSNQAGGDGCSAQCQNEKCLAQTVAPGYPTVALCEDGDPCTADACNTALAGGTCVHPAKTCDDGIACTTDSCTAGGCVHAAVDALCNDGNPCTDDFCSAGTGCGTTANSEPCSDGDSCTEADQCVAKSCQGTAIPGCGFCGDGFVQPPEACDDGNATFVSGEYCGVGCVLIPCGKPTNSSGTSPKSSDALFTLKAAVGQATCSLRVCDVDNSGKVLSSDALRILRKAVGQAVTLNCPTS